MKINVVQRSPFLPGSNRDRIYNLVYAMDGCEYDDIVAAINAVCRDRDYSNTAPQRHLDRMVEMGVVNKE